MLRRFKTGCGLLVLAAASQLLAADVRYYQENGVTYRETHYTVQHPVTETVLENQSRVVYRQKVDTTLQDSVRTYQVPVTTYQREMFVLNRWNPFAKPVIAERLVPVTRMETRTENVKLPVSRQQLVPETTVVQVPVTRTRMVNEDITSRIAVSGPVSTPPGSATQPSPTTPPGSGSQPAIASGQPPKTAASPGQSWPSQSSRR